MRQRGRTTLAWSVIVATLIIASCRDVTAPEPSLSIVVAPDSVHVDAVSGLVVVAYLIRNPTNFPLATSTSPAVEAERSPGAWSIVDNAREPRYIESEFDISIPANNSWPRQEALRLTPGRYRIRAKYLRTDAPDSGTVSNPGETVSNVIVVLP